MENKNEIFGKRLRLLREKMGKSQEGIAVEIGISRARYSHYENNHVEPDMSLIRQLAKLYSVTTDYLLGIIDIPYKDEKNKRNANIHKIANKFPDANLMFNDLANMTAEDLEEVYEFIKFKSQQKK